MHSNPASFEEPENQLPDDRIPNKPIFLKTAKYIPIYNIAFRPLSGKITKRIEISKFTKNTEELTKTIPGVDLGIFFRICIKHIFLRNSKTIENHILL
jgi:hypothetical protein